MRGGGWCRDLDRRGDIRALWSRARLRLTSIRPADMGPASALTTSNLQRRRVNDRSKLPWPRRGDLRRRWDTGVILVFRVCRRRRRVGSGGCSGGGVRRCDTREGLGVNCGWKKRLGKTAGCCEGEIRPFMTVYDYCYYYLFRYQAALARWRGCSDTTCETYIPDSFCVNDGVQVGTNK